MSIVGAIAVGIYYLRLTQPWGDKYLLSFSFNLDDRDSWEIPSSAAVEYSECGPSRAFAIVDMIISYS